MRPVNAEIIRIVRETPTVSTFYLDRSFQPEPGQFVMVWIHGIDEIPMALSYDNAITVQKVGEATSALFDFKVGNSIGIRGPFGSGFRMIGKNVLLVAGGVGSAPLAPFAEKLHSEGVRVTTLLGARTGEELVFRKRFEASGETFTATDDGSSGRKGFVTDLLEEHKDYDQVYCCGPEIMMKKVLDMADPATIQLSLHRYIKCGLGICGACCVDGLRVCKDGPVFTGDVLIKSEFGFFRRNVCGERVKI